MVRPVILDAELRAMRAMRARLGIVRDANSCLLDRFLLMNSLADRCIVVTGAGSGIGRATCLLLAEIGAAVVAADVNINHASETASLVSDLSATAIAVHADVREADSVRALFDEAARTFGPLYGLFNNAGTSEPAFGAIDCRLAELPEDVWDAVMNINAKGVWRCMAAAIEAMRPSGRGVIVNNASIAGLVGLERRAAYVASKHAVVGMTRAAAVDYASQNIRINAICPGYTATPFTKKVLTTEEVQILGRVPAERIASATEIARVAAWLMSDSASFVHGAAIAVDGGYTAV